MKRIYKRFVYFLFGLLGFMIIGCSNNQIDSSISSTFNSLVSSITNSNSENNSSNEFDSSYNSSLSSSSSSSSEDILSAEEILEAVSKLEFNDLEVKYNGEQHSIYIEGDIPKEVAVSYVGNNKVNAGQYDVSAILFDVTGQIRNLPTLEATLMIKKAKLDITFDDKTFSYDGEEHSIYINEELPSGVNVSYTNNNQIKEGIYYVTASFNDTTGNYEVPNDMTRELKIIKDGKYHDFTIIYADGSVETKVVENGYLVDYLPTYDKTGYTNYYINQKTNEKISFPYVVNSDVVLKNHYEPNTYKVNYCYEGEILFSDEVKYDSIYTFKDMYVNDEGNLLVELKYNGEIIEPGTSIKFNYLNDINIETIYMIPNNDFMFSVSGNYATITSYNGLDTELEIPKYMIDGKNYYKVTSIGSRAFYECNSLINIVIPESVTSIGDGAFLGCSSLTSILIPEGVASIGYQAFLGCSSLISITLPDTLTSIGYESFRNCSSLTSIVIPESVTSIGSGAFYNCSSLEDVYYKGTIEDWCNISFDYYDSNPMYYTDNFYMLDENNEWYLPTEIEIPSTLTSIGNYAFYGCSSLTSIVIPEGVISIGESAFSYCSSLTSIVIPESVASIGERAFCYCSSLTSITLPFIGEYADGSGKTHFGYIFGASSYSDNYNYVPSSLKEVIITNCTSIGLRAFKGCSSLISIVIPEGVTSIGYEAFHSCSSLTSITLPSTITSIGSYAFSECNSLTNIVIPDTITSIGDSAFYDCSSLTIYCEASSKLSGWSSSWNSSNRPVYWGINENNYIEIEGIEYVIIDGEAVVSRYVENNTEVIIPSTIEIKGTTYNVISIGDSAFYNCSSLTSIVIPESVTSIGDYAFYYCSNLTSIVIPEGITSIGSYAFYGCSSLTSITLPDTITSIGDSAFYYCISLTSIVIPEGVTSIGNFAFAGCRSLTSIVIPEGVTSIEGYVFCGCSSLTSIVIPESVTSIIEGAFSECISLTSIVIPEGVTSIGLIAFYDCGSLISITLPNSLTSIGGGAFYNCSSLTSIVIPESVTSIGGGAFSECSSLTIYCEASSKPSGWNSDWNYSKRPVVWNYKK